MRTLFAPVLVALACTLTPAQADHHEEGFFSIFDGKTLKDWDGNSKFWSIQDGAITGITTKDNPTKGNTFVIWRGGQVDDFELRLKFKIIGGNSGIQYRSEDKGDWIVGGYQADFEADETYSGILYEERGRGILAERGQVTHVHAGADGKAAIDVVATIGDTKVINQVINKEDWNDYKIIAHGNQFMHIINGRMTCQVIDQDDKQGAKSGVLALQLHAGPPMKVQFKDLRIKPLNGVDVAGKWDFEVITDNGSGEPQFTFETQDGNLAGDYSGAFGESKLSGNVVGNKVSWIVNASMNGQDIKCVYEGTVKGLNEMAGTATFNDQFEAVWTAKRR